LIRAEDRFDHNLYSAPFRANFFAASERKSNLNLAEWRSATSKAGNRFDTNSSEISGPPIYKIVIQGNEFERNRAHILVYNWGNLSKIRLDLLPVLEIGQEFELTEIQSDLFTPTVSSTYTEPIVVELPDGKDFYVFLVQGR
jgi:hypothetical protein